MRSWRTHGRATTPRIPGFARPAEDFDDSLAVRPGFEAKLARVVDRLSRGTYLPGPVYRAGEPDHGSGPLDAYQRCASPYHSGTCFETFRGEPVATSPAAMDA